MKTQIEKTVSDEKKRSGDFAGKSSGGPVSSGAAGGVLPNSAAAAMLGLSEPAQGYIRPELTARFDALRARFSTPPQISAAENEADRLSAGITGGTPDSVKSDMEARLGADLSSVRFHTGASAEARAAGMGARAFTEGADVFFGAGGFDPGIAAHELVHTVQQGAVEGGAPTVAAPMGLAQMWPWSKKKKEEKAPDSSAPLGRKAVSNPPKGSPVLPTWEAMKPPEGQNADTRAFSSTLGRSNMRQGSRYDRMMGSLEILNNLQGMKGQLGTDNAAYMLPAYSRAIADMEKYRKKELSRIWGKGKRRKQKDVLDQVLAQAKADEKRIREAWEAGNTEGKSVPQITSEARTVTMDDRDFLNMNGGGINTVYHYKGGYYKPYTAQTSDFEGHLSGAQNTEKGLYDRAQIRYGRDENGEIIETRNDNRDIAASRLDKLLGGNVIVGAQRASVDEGSDPTNGQADEKGRKFNAGGTRGILMDEAKGTGYWQYDWDFDTLDFGDQKVEHRKWMDRDKDARTTVGGRAKKLGLKDGKTKKETWEARKFKKDSKEKAAGHLDTADPKLQRDMNALFLEDLLMGFADRHQGNFHVEAKDGKVVGVKGIDNDTAFGERTNLNEKFNENGGLPEQMHIDRQMAEKIRAVSNQQLEFLFSDLLSPEEIKALQSRFDTVKKYIDEMEKKKLLVDEWNDETARQQLLSAKGERLYGGQGGGGNSYYQAMLMYMKDTAESEYNRNSYRDQLYR